LFASELNFRSVVTLVLFTSELDFRSAVALVLFASERNLLLYLKVISVSLFELSCRSTFDSAVIYA
jgi:hypothetical protein